jgi:heat-inducible transcriptional repressor
MVVIITSTGGVSKRVFTFEAPVDPGLAAWGGRVPQRATRRDRARCAARCARSCRIPGSGCRRPRSSRALAPRSPSWRPPPRTRLYVDGTARLFTEQRFQDLSQINELMTMLERRALLLGVLSAALSERDVLVRIGSENEAPALRSLALVAAGYGLPQRKLGTVSVIGPVRMDYPSAINSVREAAAALSRFVEEIYES